MSKKVVFVVGMAHMDGIEDMFSQGGIKSLSK
jgi:hypothetical protein